MSFFPPTGNQMPPGHDQADEQEASELDELKRRLQAAKMPPDVAKTVDRELRRLQKMMPMNQEYQVMRNWLETLSEIPWSAVTDDRLGPETLVRARKQLDDDHYGLDKVKKRLIEYLAVLRLKQSINDGLDKIRKAEAEDNESAADENAATSLDPPRMHTEPSCRSSSRSAWWTSRLSCSSSDPPASAR